MGKRLLMNHETQQAHLLTMIIMFSCLLHQSQQPFMLLSSAVLESHRIYFPFTYFLYLQITIYNRQTFHFYLSKRRFQIKLATLAALPLISLLYFSTLDDEKKLSLLHCFFDEDISFSSSIRALQFYLILQG